MTVDNRSVGHIPTSPDKLRESPFAWSVRPKPGMISHLISHSSRKGFFMSAQQAMLGHEEWDEQLLVNAARELLNYDPLTGIFTWKQRRGVVAGKSLGGDNGRGYGRITLLGESYYCHQLAWVYVHGHFPVHQIDHINGNTKDNRISNLRDVPAQKNQQNKTKAQSNSKSGVQGVSWHKKAKKWQAHICVNGARKYLGIYASIEEAKSVYENNKSKERK